MLFHICKINFKQQFRLLQKYKPFWAIISFLILSVQLYVYLELTPRFQAISNVHNTLFPLFSNISVIITVLTFFFLNIFTVRNESYLSRMPIKKKVIYMAHYYPILLSMWLFFIIQSLGGLVAFFIHVPLNFWEKTTLTLLYLAYLAIILLLTFTIKILIQTFLQKLKIYYFYLEILFTFLYIAIYMFIFVIGVYSWMYISPAYWISSAALGNPIFLIFIFITIIIQFFCFHLMISKVKDLTYNSKNSYRSIHFRGSFIYNGLLFESIQLLRDQNKKLSVLYSIFLGVSSIFISYFLFGTFNQEGYFNFFILFLGYSCSYVCMYSNAVLKSIRILPLRTTKILIGKLLFYLMLTFITFLMGLTLFKSVQMDIALINELEWSSKILFLTSLVLLVNAVMSRYAQDSKLITGFLIGFSYILIESIVNLTVSNTLYIMSVFISLTIPLCILFILFYRNDIEGWGTK